MSQEVGIAQVALGGATAALAGAFTWLWNRLASVEARFDARISEARQVSMTEVRDIWAAIDADRRSAATYRERTLERLGDMPTRADLAALENRLVALVTRRNAENP
jgi:hypothetical protein